MKRIAFYLFVLLSCWACEEEITPIAFDDQADLVVEGFIEAGELPTPPVVILTKSIPFSQSHEENALNDIFVHDAAVFVDDGSNTIQLSELCWDDLNVEQKRIILENFNLGFDSLVINVCVYTDASLSMMGEVGKRYQLRIDTEGKTLMANTIIPKHIPIDSLFFKSVSPPFWELIGFIQDDPDEVSFYRYFTSVNQGQFLAPFTSVTDDLFFNGQSFEFPLNKAERGTTPIQEYGLYTAGDTVGIKWTNIDEAHFRFWNTVEFNSFNQGPFASYTRIEGNIDGGLGVWGGYSNSYYFLIVPE